MEGDGVIGTSSLDALPMRGTRSDTALGRNRGWHEKMVDERKHKDGEQGRQQIRGYLS